jgi:hypothetical protein
LMCLGAETTKIERSRGTWKILMMKNSKSAMPKTWTVHMSNLQHDTHNISKLCYSCEDDKCPIWCIELS